VLEAVHGFDSGLLLAHQRLDAWKTTNPWVSRVLITETGAKTWTMSSCCGGLGFDFKVLSSMTET
jgi:hypothetical protein